MNQKKIIFYCRRICLTAILLCTLMYFYINYDDNITEGYFVNTAGCRILAMNPEPNFQNFWYYREVEPMKCTQSRLLRAVTRNSENYLRLSLSKQEILDTYDVEQISDICCEYKIIERDTDSANNYSSGETLYFSYEAQEIQVNKGNIILRILCKVNNQTIYHDVLFFLPEPPTSTPYTPSKADRLSVMILGIDSISHMHYLRSMPLTASFMKRHPHVELWGYNSVGENSLHNVAPLLAGQTLLELETGCYNNTLNFDNCQFLWNHFKAAGYNTSFAEDTKIGATFNHGLLGFGQQPTDFYMRPVMVEIDEHTTYSIDKQEELLCSGSRLYAKVLYEYFYKLIAHLRCAPYFSYFWNSQGVHDYFNYAQFSDKSYVRMLQHLEKEGVLQNTLVLFMADHGQRIGSFRRTYRGMLEVSQPLLIALYPKWLEETYPMAISNLRNNSHSLVTTFDLHTTLKDVINLNNLRNSHVANRTAVLQELGKNIPRGISLFLPIPGIRDCQLAGIPSILCLCEDLTPIDTSDYFSQRAAKFVVLTINRLIQDHISCQTLHLNEVQAAYVLNQDHNWHDFDIKVHLQTIPGKGEFEGNVRITDNELKLNGPISRTNRYGNQSYCAHNYKIEMYCYC